MAAGSSPRLRADHLDQPLPARFGERHRGFAPAMERHAAAVRSGAPAYADPVSGLMVFTAAFLASRGWCCSSGCRHCPFEPDAVPPQA